MTSIILASAVTVQQRTARRVMNTILHKFKQIPDYDPAINSESHSYAFLFNRFSFSWTLNSNDFEVECSAFNDDVDNLIDYATEYLCLNSSVMVEIESPCFVLGDIHGNFNVCRFHSLLHSILLV